ncbi:MAG: hypothetical protein DCF22_19700 [Leptolyngbya sp.]|nr:MAG: hypothetical protein DCF22_19700 [Leptolyngbya sp.]
MQTADSTTKATLLSYFPERIQAALSAYASELNLSPEALVQLGIGSFLESAEISAGMNDQDLPDDLMSQGVLAHLSNSMQKGIEQYATEYEFPPAAVVELAVTFLLDPDASNFEDCQVDIRREQTHLLQQYRSDRKAEAA